MTVQIIAPDVGQVDEERVDDEVGTGGGGAQ